jgi:protein-S-isoprenylcysteine O-methyltransferase Ste14
MVERRVARSALIGGLTILTVLSILFGLSYLISSLLNLPFSLNLAIIFRGLGVGIIVIALVVISWLFKFRRPADMIVSTYATFSKLLMRAPITESVGRTEPLILKGPQKYVRHPLYFGIIVLVLGWALFTATTYFFITTLLLMIWFRFVLIPFEEKELRALFGDQYKRYMKNTPMLIPFTKRRKSLDNS